MMHMLPSDFDLERDTGIRWEVVDHCTHCALVEDLRFVCSWKYTETGFGKTLWWTIRCFQVDESKVWNRIADSREKFLSDAWFRLMVDLREGL
jgi:hypothetical protein